METRIKVGDIMTRNFVSAKPDDSIINCAKKMIREHVGSLVIKQDRKLVSLISERDIIWAITKKSKKQLEKVTAKDIAARKVRTIKPSADIYTALKKMKKGKLRWLPVTKNKEVIGLLTLKDILRIEPSLFEIASKTMKIREESEKIKRLSSLKSKETEGICEECGNFGILTDIEDKLVCEDCRVS